VSLFLLKGGEVQSKEERKTFFRGDQKGGMIGVWPSNKKKKRVGEEEEKTAKKSQNWSFEGERLIGA